MSIFIPDDLELRHVKRLHENATKVLKIYTDGANPNDVDPLLKVIQTDVACLRLHHAPDSPAPSTGSSRVASGETESHEEPVSVVPKEPPRISCKDSVMREFNLNENRYRAAFV